MILTKDIMWRLGGCGTNNLSLYNVSNFRKTNVYGIEIENKFFNDKKIIGRLFYLSKRMYSLGLESSSYEGTHFSLFDYVNSWAVHDVHDITTDY